MVNDARHGLTAHRDNCQAFPFGNRSPDKRECRAVECRGKVIHRALSTRTKPLRTTSCSVASNVYYFKANQDSLTNQISGRIQSV